MRLIASQHEWRKHLSDCKSVLRKADYTMCNTITSIIDKIISFAISEGTSTVSEIIDKQRRQKALQESIQKILESEQSNFYYDDLIRLLSDTRILQDCFSSYATGNPP